MLKSKIRIGVDGVILKHCSYQATPLPQVWKELPTFYIFFSHLCQKAGMYKDGLSSNLQTFTYQVNKYSEI
ncbi:MAG: hypothetical protein COA92_06095 [Sulfurovum sp.]|nr:MAG: hypothetical protein COA92_06095 [Sulfurovum sp.]